ncbi:MAG: oligosaccharide flippase family protein, partial [Coriobacteriia bacterium]|nr:oligosaccharide flippase family protein [Coriobacteriia bacterium]
MSVVRNSVLAFLPHVAGLVAGLLTSIITARYLGASGRGVLTLVLMALGMLLLVADGGVSASVTYLVSAGRLNRRQALRLCIGAAVLLGVIAWGLAALAWFALSASALKGVSPAQYTAGLVALPAMLFTTFWSRLSMARGEFAPVLRLQSSLSAGGLLLAFLVLPVAGRGVFELVATLSVMHWIAAAWLLLSERRSHGAPTRLPPGTLSEAVSYGSRSYLGSLVSYATLRIDAFVLNAYWGSAAVGRYTIAV